MKCYIDTHNAQPAATGWYADVVTHQDYYECGPWARSHRTEVKEEKSVAVAEAKEWATKMGYQIVKPEEI